MYIERFFGYFEFLVILLVMQVFPILNSNLHSKFKYLFYLSHWQTNCQEQKKVIKCVYFQAKTVAFILVLIWFVSFVAVLPTAFLLPCCLASNCPFALLSSQKLSFCPAVLPSADLLPCCLVKS